MTSDDTIQRTYKTKLTLNNRERSIMAGCAGFSRFVYNWGLAEAKREHEETGKIPSPRAVLKKRLNAIKRDESPWMADYPYVILQETFDDLERAFKNYFRRIKNGETKFGYPRFKRRGEHDSFRLVGSIRIEEGRIKLPRIGWLRLARRRSARRVAHQTPARRRSTPTEDKSNTRQTDTQSPARRNPALNNP